MESEGSMGRQEPGGCGREYRLKELDPPGVAYETWFIPPLDTDVVPVGLDGVAAASLERVRRLGPVYGGAVPEAAVRLDVRLDAELGPGESAVRARAHRLHAHGHVLVEAEDDQAVPRLRLVHRRPRRPGEAWVLADGTEDGAADGTEAGV
ncbi:hypothetical protein ACF065_13610 [Streptomyces sp. NPDC015232]|uniref:hypothetical protein n=1 Tax=unclassified Streptomyces TaxID=2593676 RepID=UPI0036FA6D5E